MYTIFPAVFWDRREPPDLRPAPPVRLARMAERVKPTLSIPTITWIKAIHAPTSEFMGLACWTQPDNPSIHNLWGRSAIKHYGLQEKMNWTDEQIRDMWAGVDEDAWDKEITLYDKAREEVLKDERHWFLAPLMVYPDYQGRGVGHRLLDWAIEQADATVPPTPLYLESAQTARAVYLHCGFVPCGKVNMVRRGPPKD
jgi:GNAT superfamily N-acetyltransferase